jgi:DNA gyrase/topoisomerase IV subunit A
MLDENGNIKRMLTSQYKANKKLKHKTTEIAEDKKLILISNKGMMYKLPVKQIPKASANSIGIAVANLVTLQNGEFIINIFNSLEAEPYMFFITKNGLAKKTPYTDISNISKTIGTVVMKLAEDDEIILCKLLESENIKVLHNNKEKMVSTDKFITKSRTAGGVVAVKVKPGSFISIL